MSDRDHERNRLAVSLQLEPSEQLRGRMKRHTGSVESKVSRRGPGKGGCAGQQEGSRMFRSRI